MALEITYADERYFISFREALDSVAREKTYIEMIEVPPQEGINEFQRKLIAANAPVFYALDGEKVVGWCDISLKENPRMQHRGTLGIGIIRDYRGLGLGSKLMQQALAHAPRAGLEKVELQVYTTNTRAIELYKKFGFVEEGLLRNYRKLDGTYYDCLAMYKFV